MKLKAKLGPWSSMVGQGVHLIGPDGRMEAQIAFLHDDDQEIALNPIAWCPIPNLGEVNHD